MTDKILSTILKVVETEDAKAAVRKELQLEDGKDIKELLSEDTRGNDGK
jgi:hypothetical protein